MENAIIQRITEIIELKGKNVTRFSKLINVPQTTLNNYIKGSRKVSFELISSILSAFPDISAEWLMRGEGDMMRTEHSTESKEIEHLQSKLEQANETISMLVTRLSGISTLPKKGVASM